LIASEERIKPFTDEVSFAIAQGVNSSSKVKQKFPVPGGFEVKQTHDFFPTKEQVIGEQVTMNKSLGEPIVLIFLLICDLVIKHVNDLLKMAGKAFFDFLIERYNAGKTEAVLFAFGGVFAQQME